MKNVVIPIGSNSMAKLLIELAKKLGLNPYVESRKEMEWEFMPEDDVKLEQMIEKAERNFRKGRYLTADEVKKRISQWK